MAKVCQMSHQQACDHNNVHEALLMNGYRWRYVPLEVEDAGGPESGPMVSVSGDFYEYINDQECVITVNGEIVHREKRDLETEKFFATMCDGPYNDPVYL